MTTPLRLIALDTDDVAVISAHLQDAVGTLGDMAWLPKERRFVALLNRFDALSDGGKGAAGVRRRTALRLERVTAAQVQGVDLKAKGQVVNVLALMFESGAEPPAGVLTLVLSGGAAMRFKVECVEAVLEDLGPAWAAAAKPTHE